ncbi:hypothetical protein [Acidihalobacter prosperus]|uniref:Dinitrogenase iron-molybdenum cofactor biosynthesis domain-containing protein n=1 Tax=Acidihalobacter prosperus TaxID=160660 RepID=A0A1A6C7U4_9GAMM|nr:hypothetical protein [Acidihalobacter prosperus]OBS10620.1 hypothetical protein Thpro_020336 [Acidihalobacter prosperus]
MHANSGEPAWRLCDAAPSDRIDGCAVVAVDEGASFALYDCGRHEPELIGRIIIPLDGCPPAALAVRLVDCDLVLVREPHAALGVQLAHCGVDTRRLGDARKTAAAATAWRAWRHRAQDAASTAQPA